MTDNTPLPPAYEPALNGAIRQGEVISGLTQYKIDWANTDVQNSDFSVVFVGHPYAIVVSQDCDLDWDHKSRGNDQLSGKTIPNILFCEMVTAFELKSNESLRSSNIWKNLQQNKNERYHFLQRASQNEDAVIEGLPELGVDFKRYFSLPADEVYIQLTWENVRRRCRLQSPYLEHFSSRFYYFQSRIALPADHFSEPNQ